MSLSLITTTPFQREKSHHHLKQPPLLLPTLFLPLILPLAPDPLIDYPQRLLALRRRRQVLVPVRRDQDIVLDPHPAHGVVLLQQGLVDVRRVPRVLDVVAESVAREVAEVGRCWLAGV